MTCRHADTFWIIENSELGATGLHFLTLTGRCNACGCKLAVRGVPTGISADHPTGVSDGTLIRLPWTAVGEHVDVPPIGFARRRVKERFPASPAGEAER